MWAKLTAKGYGLIAAAAAIAVVLIACALLYAFEPWNAEGRASGVAPKASLADYTWDELSAIAEEISECTSQQEACDAAKRYGLCDETGGLAGASAGTKELELADGRVASVRLAGIWHDDRSDGGKAGLTFVFADAVGEHAMNHAFESDEYENADSVGGWGASDMRMWLNDYLFYELPFDLRSRIVSVQKNSASAIGVRDELDEPGRLAGAPSDWVSQTSDKLWLLSVSELSGDVPAQDDLGIDHSMALAYGAEGSQYRLFADWGVTAFEPCSELVLGRGAEGEPTTWWLRSKTLEFGEGFWLVGSDGAPLDGLGEDARVVTDPAYAPDKLWGPDHARGVVAGFCL